MDDVHNNLHRPCSFTHIYRKGLSYLNVLPEYEKCCCFNCVFKLKAIFIRVLRQFKDWDQHSYGSSQDTEGRLILWFLICDRVFCHIFLSTGIILADPSDPTAANLSVTIGEEIGKAVCPRSTPRALDWEIGWLMITTYKEKAVPQRIYSSLPTSSPTPKHIRHQFNYLIQLR